MLIAPFTVQVQTNGGTWRNRGHNDDLPAARREIHRMQSARKSIPIAERPDVSVRIINGYGKIIQEASQLK